MGSWGYKPQDSDASLDIQYRVDEAVNSALKDIFMKSATSMEK